MASNSKSGDGRIYVRHSEAELVVPAKPTPREVKDLSDLDDQEGLRMHLSFIMFYKSNPNMKQVDPAKLIKRGISEALVHYYPLAGRLAEGHKRKLVVECSGEGVLFVEADAHVSLEQLGHSIGPPSPHREQFLHLLPASQEIIASPLFLIQVTRLSCGGFVLGVRMNHVVCDAFGLVQFLNMVATLAWDPHAAIQPPVWKREIFSARHPPRVTCIHNEYEDVVVDTTTTHSMNNNLAHESFFFGPKEILTLRKRLPLNLQKCSTLELLCACLWKCRTLALELSPNEVVGVACFITAHGKVEVPKGYYGNAFVFPIALSKADLLCQNSLGYALGLIREAKARMSEEYVRSVVDLMVLKERPMYKTNGNFFVGDITRVGFGELDFGWGKPVYGGPVGAVPFISYLARFRNGRGEDGIMVPILLPHLAMRRFLWELTKMTSEQEFHLDANRKTGARSMI